MAIGRLIERVDVERVIAPQDVVDFCDDDGDGEADGPVVEAMLDQASRVAANLLRGWTAARVEEAVAADPGLRGALAQIAAGLMGERRRQFRDAQGKGPTHKLLELGRETVRAIAAGEERTAAEPDIGPPVNAKASANVPADGESFIAPTSVYPSGRGGF
jgi:hypothetical protein